MRLAWSLKERTEKGRGYGAITAKDCAVLQALLWGFHNARTGLCFPSLARIAEAARCAVATVATAIKRLEAAGLLTWVNRLKRVRELVPGLFGLASRWRVIRTSNGYRFNDPKPSNSNFQTGTENQESLILNIKPLKPESPLEIALSRLREARKGVADEEGGEPHRQESGEPHRQANRRL